MKAPLDALLRLGVGGHLRGGALGEEERVRSASIWVGIDMVGVLSGGKCKEEKLNHDGAW